MSDYHIPVLLNESISALVSDLGGTYIDATFGGGGHTSEILSRLNESGKVIAFDRDNDAIKNRLKDNRLILIHNNFRFIHNYMMFEAYKEGLGEKQIFADGILADLGVSSHQFDTAERGFSFRYDAPLDMRMNTESDITAADIINGYEADELEKVMRIYGEVDNAKRLTSLIIAARAKQKITTTFELGKAIDSVIPKIAGHKYLAKVYQGLRIEVNQEMKSLEKFLEGATLSLKEGGKLVIITYQSLEDRMVKNFIRTGNIEGRVQKDFYGNSFTPLAAINKKPILPKESEIASNTRARSAKLRIAAKLQTTKVTVGNESF